MKCGKVLVVGAAEAGKSTLIQALVPGAMNLAVNGRTVAMDHAVLTRGEYTISLVGVPGQRRFGPVRDVLANGARCAIWVHRAGEAVDETTLDLVVELAGRNVPFVVFLNQYNGFQGNDKWMAPRGCSEPLAVFAGNLIDPGASLESLQDAVWRVVS